MDKKYKRILVTSALPYANGPIHLGHLAGAYLPADVYVRYQRLKGRDVVYICGSDEHGVPIMLRARHEGVSPQEIVDRYHEQNKKAFAGFGMSFDYYGRTSSSVHHQTSQEFFKVLAQKNEFVLKMEEQLYDPEAKMFLADRFVRGTCPICGYEDAYGDQCENCGTSLSPKELQNPRSAVTDAKPVMKQTTHWYLPLAAYQQKLEAWISTHTEWKQNVLGQIHSWFSQGLNDRAVTRDLPWGVSIPDKIAEQYQVDAEGKVLYVWFDAPIGYISATKEWAAAQGRPDLWKTYWQDEDTMLVHFIGKDNIVFHCIIFPAMLMAHQKFVLPENVPANEFLNLEGNKLSTSRNYAVWLEEYLKKFPVDPLRYCLAANAPETKDADFSWRDFQARNNNELADIMGNFINRTLTFTENNFDGLVPEPAELDELDKQMLDTIANAPRKIGDFIEKFELRKSVTALMDVCRFANKYFNDQEPWATVNTKRAKCATTIHLCLQAVKTLSVLMEPVLPNSAEKTWKMLNLAGDVHQQAWDSAYDAQMAPGHRLGKAEILFEKIDDSLIEPEIERLDRIAAHFNSTESEEQMSEPSESISFVDFKKIKLRTAKVVEAERVPKTNKLLKLQIELGSEKRQIIAGIAETYLPEELLGKTIVVVANLEPATIRGEESNGMLLAAIDADDKAILLVPDKDIPSGAEVS